MADSTAPYDASESERVFNICKDARSFLTEAEQFENANRRDGLDDLKFLKGDHWSDQAKADRGVGTPEERPTITINKFKTFLHQVTNDGRQNRPSINVSPVGDGGDVKVAEIYRGMIRAIQRNSDAEIAIDTAAQAAAANGWGYWRINTEYESDDSFDQVLVWRRIRNCMSVFCDPDSQDPTTADKRRCIIIDSLHKDVFKRKYPNASPLNWDATAYQTLGAQTWFLDNHITVAEYWVVECDTRRLVKLDDGFVGYFNDLDPAVKQRIKAGELEILDEREVEQKTVKCYKLTAHEIIDEYEWLDEIIPIIRAIGDEIDNGDGTVTLSGIVRDGKQPAQMYDYWVSAETEAVALMPKAPYILEEGQVDGHEKKWNNANKKNYPYLSYKGTSVGGKPAPPPQRNPFSGPPAAIIAAKEGAAQDLLSTTGIRFDASKQERTFDESGTALAHLRQNTDLGAYHYHDNIGYAQKVTGGIFVRMIPKIYNRKRIVTIVRENGTEEHVQIDPFQSEPVSYTKDRRGRKIRSFNPKIGKYAVAVTLGPNYATKRQAQSAGMLEFMRALPNTAPLIAHKVAAVQDWEGAEEISRIIATTLPPGVLQPEGEMMEGLTPEAEALIMQQQQQLQQMQQEKQQLIQALQEKQSAIAIDQEKNQIDQQKVMLDFEAKLQKIAADMEANMVEHINDRIEATHKQALAIEQLDIDRTRANAQMLQALQPERTQ